MSLVKQYGVFGKDGELGLVEAPGVHEAFLAGREKWGDACRYAALVQSTVHSPESTVRSPVRREPMFEPNTAKITDPIWDSRNSAEPRPGIEPGGNP